MIKQKTIAKAKVLALPECIAYEEGAIVSKRVIGKSSGNVTLFSFDKTESLSEHTVPFDALVCVLDGTASIRISSKKYRLGAGEAIVLPANKPHAVKAITRFKMMLVMIKK
jgi:quercetin dioxygenase-like cupin family protein